MNLWSESAAASLSHNWSERELYRKCPGCSLVQTKLRWLGEWIANEEDNREEGSFMKGERMGAAEKTLNNYSPGSESTWGCE